MPELLESLTWKAMLRSRDSRSGMWEVSLLAKRGCWDTEMSNTEMYLKGELFCYKRSSMNLSKNTPSEFHL